MMSAGDISLYDFGCFSRHAFVPLSKCTLSICDDTNKAQRGFCTADPPCKPHEGINEPAQDSSHARYCK